MYQFQHGDYARVIDEQRVFRITDFTNGRKHIPDGWLIDETGCAINPAFCEPHGTDNLLLPHEHHGWLDGEICNRDGCKGEMKELDRDGCCSCHINPPCSYCTSADYQCRECGSLVESA